MENHLGLANFVKVRSKFEGWLKVEICDILAEKFDDVYPEKERIDISFDNWLIELKTINTNYRFNEVDKKHRPISKNIEGVLEDIKKLKRMEGNRGVIFIVFPVSLNNIEWTCHIKKIEDELTLLRYTQFKFRNNVLAITYFGLI